MATMIRRHKPSAHFTMIRNDVLRDKRLSWKARGVLAHILSLPSGQTFTAASIAKDGGSGRDAVLGAFKELREHGYMITTNVRQANGTIVKTTEVFDTPDDHESVGKSATTEVENPNLGGPDRYIEEGYIEERVSKDTLSKRGKPVSDNEPSRHAEALVRDAWERVRHDTGTAPVWSFIGVRKLVEAQLRSGAASPDELAVVLPTMTAITINTLAIALAKYRDTPESRSARNRAAASRRLAELEANEAAWRSGING